MTLSFYDKLYSFITCIQDAEKTKNVDRGGKPNNLAHWMNDALFAAHLGEKWNSSRYELIKDILDSMECVSNSDTTAEELLEDKAVDIAERCFDEWSENDYLDWFKNGDNRLDDCNDHLFVSFIQTALRGGALESATKSCISLIRSIDAAWTSAETFNPDVHVQLLLDGTMLGRYVPQAFCEKHCPTEAAAEALGVQWWPVVTCLKGPDAVEFQEEYDNAWDLITRDATLQLDGHEWLLHEDEDLFIVRKDVEVPEDYWL